MFNFKKNYISNKKYINKLFIIMIICTFLYIINKTIIIKHSSGLINYFFICYFNDILAGILIILLINGLMMMFFSKRINNLLQIIIIILIIGLIWEYSPNLIKKNAISDFYDIVAYEIGGLFYWIIIYIKGGKYE
ncbi:MAG: hypothetical protein VZS44_00755 [Bacilli bacterium]|nr:hypothetical protein [Bacilli bacterium]